MGIAYIAFGIMGMMTEVAFGALKSLLGERSYELKGGTSLWMFPVYGLIALIYPVVAIRIGELTWYLRGVVYVLIIYLITYLYGWLLTKMRVRPWNFPEKWSLGGFIYIPHAPLWFAFGLGVEWMWPKIKAISYALG